MSVLRKGSRLDLQNLVGPVASMTCRTQVLHLAGTQVCPLNFLYGDPRTCSEGQTVFPSVFVPWHTHLASSRPVHKGSMLAVTSPNEGSALELTHPMPAKSTGTTAKHHVGLHVACEIPCTKFWLEERLTTEKHKLTTKVQKPTSGWDLHFSKASP